MAAVGRPGQVRRARDQADRRREQVDRVLEVDLVLHPDPPAEHGDQAIQDDRRATEHADRDADDERTELRDHAQRDGREARDDVGSGRVDLGRRHDADVLGVGRGTRTAAETGGHGGEAVTHEATAEGPVQVAAGHRPDGLDVAGVLRQQHDTTGTIRPIARQVKCGAVKSGEAEPLRGVPVAPEQVELAAAARPPGSRRSRRAGSRSGRRSR